MVSDAYLFCFNSVHNSRQSLHLAVGGHIVSRLRKLLSEGATGAADSNLAKNMRAKVTLQNMFQGALCSLAQSRWRRIHFAPLLSGLRFKQKFKQTLNSKRTCSFCQDTSRLGTFVFVYDLLCSSSRTGGLLEAKGLSSGKN